MHKILAAVASLAFLGFPIFASAQSTNQPSTKKETAGKPDASAKTATASNKTKKAANNGSMKRHAKLMKKKRLAMHGHKMRHATAKHGKRFAKSPSRHRHAANFSTGKRMHRASAKSRAANARGQISIKPRTAYRAEAPTQRNCGEFMYWKDGKCNDARNKKPAK
jgi:hypothetical protein